MARPIIEVEAEDSPIEPFVFDRGNPGVRKLLKAGVPEDKLKALDGDYRLAAEELGEPVPGRDQTLVEKRG